MIRRGLIFVLLLAPTAGTQERSPAASSPLPRAAQEEFLRNASFVGERRSIGQQYAWRASLSDGKRTHDAAVETEDGTTPAQRDYRFNVAAYELDKALRLNLVAPSVERMVSGQPASVTWWVDDVAMAEVDRRAKNIQPPDLENWQQQMQAVRVFDELASNPYRNMHPERVLAAGPGAGAKPDYSWGELLITRGWRVWLIDHTATFRILRQLQHPQTLTRCDRALLRRLRELNRDSFQQTLGKYLTAEQLDALEARRKLLVSHFDEQIRGKGESAALYDLPPL